MRWLMNRNRTSIIISNLLILLCYINTLQQQQQYNNKGFVTSFTILCMIRRRSGSSGNLQRILNDENDDNSSTKDRKTKSKNNNNSINQGKGQLITGVTLPKEGTMKGWELGTTDNNNNNNNNNQNIRVVCCNVNDVYYAIQGECPRCGFDLYRGDLITSDKYDIDVWDELPRVACPTCSTTYSMKTGKYGPPMKRTGLQNFVSNLAKTATSQEANKNAKTYIITVDPNDGNIYYR